MESRNIKSIAIIGGGVAGWMSAALLANTLGQSVVITLVDFGADPQAALNQATIPPLKAFHNSLGLNEADLISKCQGSMKLGTQFVNWGSLGNRYFHPHGSYGAEFDIVPLHQWWLKSRDEHNSTHNLDQLSMAWALAQEGRFSLPLSDRRMIQSTFDYAHHLDGKLYCDYLANYAKARDVKVVDGTVVKVARNAETGFVTDVTLDSAQAITADLFIDCSGHQTLMSDPAKSGDFVDWKSYLPCNRAISISCAKGGEFTPYSRITARSAGWQWRIPLQHRTSMGYVYASDLMSDDGALGDLMDNLDGRSIDDPVVTSFINGRRIHSFDKNVVAIGAAAGFLEPLEATQLHFIQSGLTRLLALWPTRACDPIIARDYNDLTAAEWDLARDFLILHYKATSRSDSPLWQACKDMAIPDSLKTRLDHWQSSGRLVSPRPELFQSPSWLSVLVGQDIMPSAWDPLADARADRVDYQARLSGLERVIQETAAQSPLHRDWIEKHARGVRT